MDNDTSKMLTIAEDFVKWLNEESDKVDWDANDIQETIKFFIN